MEDKNTVARHGRQAGEQFSVRDRRPNKDRNWEAVMRILGLVLMIVGIVFELLLILARLGGGKVSPAPFVVSAMIFVVGMRLRSYGKGINQKESLSGMGEATPSPSESPTMELPVTPAVTAVIVNRAARSRRIIGIIIVSGLVFFLLLGEGIDLAVSSPGGLKALPFLTCAGLLFGLIVGWIWVFPRELTIRKDLRDSTYLRTSGPVRVVQVYGGWLLRLSDRSFLTEARPAKALGKLTRATVDYSRHAHMIFEIRNDSGQIVYSEFEKVQY